MSLAVVVAVVVAGAVAEPVAVMPWKNLGGAEHAWLSLGMQETLTSDLRRARTQVVERGRLAEAMRDRGVDDVVGAAAVGRLVGAKTLVLGSFQVQGQGLRLTARFVDVATGEVLQATTETGTLDDVFRLQDAVVRALAPTSPSSKSKSSSQSQPAPSTRPKLKPPQVIAYQRFSESLASTTPEAARALLEEALRLDADFVYAKDALVALGAKVDVAVDAVTAAVLARADRSVAVAVDAGAAVDVRVAAAKDALASLERGRCFHRLLAVSERVLATPALSSTSTSTPPTSPTSTLAEDASAARVLALARLRRAQLALQAGEKHLIAFAGGARTDDVATVLRKIAEEQRSEPARRAEYVAELADAQGDDATAVFRRCIAAKWSLLPAEMEQNCRAFLTRYERDVTVAVNVRSARAYVAWARALVGDFAAARRLAAALEAADPGALDDSGLREVIDAAWSRD